MSRLSILATSFLLSTVLGCSSANKSPWNARVLQSAENPRNGLTNYGPMRAEIVKYKCGLFERCTTVRFVNEVANDDVFTYYGNAELNIRWTGFQDISTGCPDCKADRTRLKKTEMDYVTISYNF